MNEIKKGGVGRTSKVMLGALAIFVMLAIMSPLASAYSVTVYPANMSHEMGFSDMSNGPNLIT